MDGFDFLDLEDILIYEYRIFAHTNENKPKETLAEHTKLCHKYYQRIYQKKHLKTFFYTSLNELLPDRSECAERLFFELIHNVVTFHDTGKVNPEFQRVKMKEEIDETYSVKWLPGTNHSMFSAFIYLNHYMPQIDAGELTKQEKIILRGICLISAMVISRHHSDLCNMQDFISDFNPQNQACIAGDIEDGLIKKPMFIRDTVYSKRGQYPSRWKTFTKQLKEKPDLQIGIFLYARVLYSVLVSSDFYATTEYNNGLEIKDLGIITEHDGIRNAYESTELIKGIRKAALNKIGITDFSNAENINILRTELFLEAEQGLKDNLSAGVYFLEAPTGSGKSNTAMNLSFQLLEEGLEKLYYVYPFNTLVEQNLNILEETFGTGSRIFDKITVLNSNTPMKIEKRDPDEEVPLEDYARALLDRQFLNYPFILTTHVSLFQTLFSSEREALFGFVQLKDSIIVLDEIQSYKNGIWSEIIIFLKAFAKFLNMKVLIMSATLPDLNYLTGQRDGVAKLVNHTERFFKAPLFRDRVSISYELLEEKISMEELKQHVLKTYSEGKKTVVEFIKKKSALKFAEMLMEDESVLCQVMLFTGDDNRADRLKKIRHLKNSKEGLILVATQVIEAGVDIDMDVGYKDISKLDAEEQFLGRINRSCKRTGIVYFFDMDNAKGIYSDGDYRISSDLLLTNPEMQDILKHKNFSEYYRRVMIYLKSLKNESFNEEENLDYFFTNQVGGLCFRDVSQRMKLIEDNDWTISVFLNRKISLDDGTELIGSEVWNEYLRLLSDYEMDYAEKQYRQSEVRSRMNYFIYEINKKSKPLFSSKIGELYYIEDGEDYFTNGVFNREKLEGGDLFL